MRYLHNETQRYDETTQYSWTLDVHPRSVDNANEVTYAGPEPPVDDNFVEHRSDSQGSIKETEVIVMKSEMWNFLIGGRVRRRSCPVPGG